MFAMQNRPHNSGSRERHYFDARIQMSKFTDLYKNIGRHHPQLSESEMNAMAARGSIRDQNEIALANLPLAKWFCAKKMAHIAPFESESILQESIFGLMYAAKSYKPSIGTKFSTYAKTWMHAAVMLFLKRDASLIRMPKAMRLRDRYSVDLVSSKTLDRNPGLNAQVETIAENTDLNRTVRHALARMTTADRQLVTLRFGLDGGLPHTLERIGSVYGVTREAIRWRETKILKTLSRVKGLREYWSDR